MTTAGALFAATPPEEDYIDMELTYSIGSSPPPPPPARDFEFQIQMTSFSDETEGKNSPADELFYNGKLLPLHRLQRVENLISKTPSTKQDYFSQNFQIPLISIKAPPHESCKFSLTESCRPSCELNPDEFLLGIKGFVEENPPRKSWSKKVKQLKKSFKALFSKSACSNEETETVFENRGSSGKFINVSERNPFGKIDYNKWQIPNNSKIEEFNGGILNLSNHRKSFSGAIQSVSSSINKKPCSSSSCSSSSSNGVSDLQLFKRSISSNSEIESSIEGAIAHCKQSQKLFVNSRDIEAVCSISASKVLACGDKKSSELCRI